MQSDSALLIIDMQNDFVCNQNSPVYIRNAVSIIQPIIDIKNKFKQSGNKIINIITVHSKNKNFWGNKDIELDRYYCIENTEETKIISELKPAADELIIRKKYYSGFFETDLKSKLDELKIRNLYFAGLTTGCCVSSTARDAYNYKYNLFFLKDCLTSSDINAHNYELEFFSKSLGTVIAESN